MGRSVEIVASILFGVIGLSHILQPKAWVEFFILLRGKGETGAFMDGFLNLPFGAIIVGFHNIWSGIPVLLTLLGWGLHQGLDSLLRTETGVEDDGVGLRGAALGVPGGWRPLDGPCRPPWLRVYLG